MPIIKLRHIEPVTGVEKGNLLLSIDSIESVKDFDNPMEKGSEVTMKPVINGFHGDDDLIHKYQNAHFVVESVEEISTLIESASNNKLAQ